MAAQALTGLTGLAGYQVTIDENSQATPEERMGGVADPAHADYLAQKDIPRGSRMGTPIGPYGPDNQLLGDELYFFEAGGTPAQDPNFDYTPNTHAGPWPKGVASGPNLGDVGPDAMAERRRQSYLLHSEGTNGSAHLTRDRDEAQNDQWETIDQLNPGHSDLDSGLPKQQRSSGFGWGWRDRTLSMARQNDYGFDSAHQHRRYAVGSIPGNYMWMKPGGRPMVKGLPGPARPPIGVDSPFTGQNLGQSFSVDGAILQNTPTEYVAPPQPTLAAAPPANSNDSYVEWY
jgi:hypothetical protein